MLLRQDNQGGESTSMYKKIKESLKFFQESEWWKDLGKKEAKIVELKTDSAAAGEAVKPSADHEAALFILIILLLLSKKQNTP